MRRWVGTYECLDVVFALGVPSHDEAFHLAAEGHTGRALAARGQRCRFRRKETGNSRDRVCGFGGGPAAPRRRFESGPVGEAHSHVYRGGQDNVLATGRVLIDDRARDSFEGDARDVELRTGGNGDVAESEVSGLQP